ncbi:unnamed protein product [Porites lobata]|uniref:Uncharacterized protein n=1 Tax=Porites lobata TaxID=104759 RepID=A0ABN8QE94_9CNID|nr:unnamed protein product [Porites lobata]
MSECSDLLNKCHVHVALKGSQFDNEVIVRYINHARQSENGADVEVRVYQPTMSLANMVVGDIISGDDLTVNVRRAVGEAIVAAQAEMSCRTHAQKKDKEEDDHEEESLDATVVDTEEVRERRINKFKQKEGPRDPKIPIKDDDDDEDANDSTMVRLL